MKFANKTLGLTELIREDPWCLLQRIAFRVHRQAIENLIFSDRLLPQRDIVQFHPGVGLKGLRAWQNAYSYLGRQSLFTQQPAKHHGLRETICAARANPRRDGCQFGTALGKVHVMLTMHHRASMSFHLGQTARSVEAKYAQCNPGYREQKKKTVNKAAFPGRQRAPSAKFSLQVIQL